jgi:hypothetical protein
VKKQTRSGLREPRGEDLGGVRNVVVLGAGTMGKQIAVQCAGHGYNVTLYDVDSAALNGAKDQMAGIINWLSTSGHFRLGQGGPILEKIRVEAEYAAAGSGVLSGEFSSKANSLQPSRRFVVED